MRILASCIVLLASLVTVFAQDQQARLHTLRAEGYEALYNLDYEGARRRFQKMIELAPDHPAGPQCYASSLWVQQLNQAWELKATLYSTSAYTNEKPKADRRRTEEFRNWIR